MVSDRSADGAQDVYGEMWRVGREVCAASGIVVSDRYRNVELNKLQSMRIGRIGSQRTNAIRISLELLRRAIETAQESAELRDHRRAVLELVKLLRTSANGRPKLFRTAASMSRSLVTMLDPLPAWATRYIRAAPASARNTDIAGFSGLSRSQWYSFVQMVISQTNLRRVSAADQIAAADERTVDLGVAGRLARLAAVEPEPSAIPPSTYDMSERSLRLVAVEVAGFRGSTESARLDLTKQGEPTNVLIWGDNGVGKSTLIDGIEFALQRRVDRSSDFNSSSRSSIRNLSSDNATAIVELSDGSAVKRSIVTNRAGRDEPSHPHVRPGFRIAPIVIRRTDIIRFLDTDALSRGTVFFDYFPDPSGLLGQRPNEELKTLEEERFLLFVARTDLAAQLASMYPDNEADFANSTELQAFVQELFTSHDPHGGADLEALPEGVRLVVAQLRQTQNRLREIRRKLDKGANPEPNSLRFATSARSTCTAVSGSRPY